MKGHEQELWCDRTHDRRVLCMRKPSPNSPARAIYHRPFLGKPIYILVSEMLTLQAPSLHSYVGRCYQRVLLVTYTSSICNQCSMYSLIHMLMSGRNHSGKESVVRMASFMSCFTLTSNHLAYMWIKAPKSRIIQPFTNVQDVQPLLQYSSHTTILQSLAGIRGAVISSRDLPIGPSGEAT